MFFLQEITTKIKLPPNNFNSSYLKFIKDTLISKYESQLDQFYGFIVKIRKITELKQLKVLNSDGSMIFEVKFECLTFNPRKNQVIDGFITQVNQLGVYVSLGPVVACIQRMCLPLEYEYSFNNLGEKLFVDKNDSSNKLEKGVLIRFRIAGTRKDENSFEVLGVINDNFLGPLN